MTFGENQKGKTYAFTTFSPFVSTLQGLGKLLIFLAAHEEEIQKTVRSRNFLHYGAFMRVSPRALRRAGIPTRGRLRHGGMLFMSAFNGDPEVYFRGFSEHLRTHMNDLWNGTAAWKDAFPYQNLRKYILRHNRSVTAHVNTYPSYAAGVRRALEMREVVDRLMASAASETNQAFEETFKRTVLKIWGNA